MEDTELYHYGVKGMKWGVRRDRSTGRKLTREVAAAKRNYRQVSSDAYTDEGNYQNAIRNYSKAQTRPSLSRSKKMERVSEAERELNRATGRLENARTRVARARNSYKNSENKLKAHVNEMVKKYGNENVRTITEDSYKEYSLGKNYTSTMLKTGVTLADLPIIGNMYTGRYVARQEQARRNDLLNERANERANKHYR